LGEDRVIIWRTYIIASHGNIQDNIKGMIKDPISAHISWGNGLIKYIIYIEIYVIAPPLYCEQVERSVKAAIAEILSFRHPGGCGITRSMHRAMNSAGLLSPVFHDIDLTAIRPAYRLKI
jgi:hypothetical protein